MSSQTKATNCSISNKKVHCNQNVPFTCIEDTIKIEDVNKNVHPIHFVRTGSGPNAVLLMPGVMGFAEYAFQPQIDGLPKLLENYTIIAWDPPGYGDSRPPARSIPVGYYRRDAYFADALMRELGFKKYSIIGWCDGGTAALLMASDFPETVESLIIMGTTAYITPDDAAFLETMRDISTWPSFALDPMVAKYGYENVLDLWINWLDNVHLSCNSDGEKVTKKELGRIIAPTLIVHGGRDPFLSGDHIPHLRKYIKSTEYYVIAEASHSLHLHRPDEFNRVASEFLLRHTENNAE